MLGFIICTMVFLIYIFARLAKKHYNKNKEKRKRKSSNKSKSNLMTDDIKPSINKEIELGVELQNIEGNAKDGSTALKLIRMDSLSMKNDFNSLILPNNEGNKTQENIIQIIANDNYENNELDNDIITNGECDLEIYQEIFDNEDNIKPIKRIKTNGENYIENEDEINDEVIQQNIQLNQIDIYDLTAGNVLPNEFVTKNGYDANPINENENDIIIAKEYNKNLSDVHQLTKGNINPNNFVTKK